MKESNAGGVELLYVLDADRDGVIDVLPVRDIRIGFKTYSNFGK